MNTITLSGHAGRDAEVRTTPSLGKQVASLRFAMSQGKGKPSLWLDVDAWEPSWAFDRLANIRKGQGVVVSGRLTVREWTDKDGQVRQQLGITAADVEVIAEREPQQEQRSERQEPARPAPNVRRDEVPYSDDEDVPF